MNPKKGHIIRSWKMKFMMLLTGKRFIQIPLNQHCNLSSSLWHELNIHSVKPLFTSSMHATNLLCTQRHTPLRLNHPGSPSPRHTHGCTWHTQGRLYTAWRLGGTSVELNLHRAHRRRLGRETKNWKDYGVIQFSFWKLGKETVKSGIIVLINKKVYDNF